MTRHATALLSAAVLSALLTLPASAWAISDDPALGGTSAETGKHKHGSAESDSSTPPPADAGSSALRAGAGALLGRAQRASGTLANAGSGLPVLLQLGDGNGWESVARTRTVEGGGFAAVWRASRTGRFTLRAVVERGGRARSAGQSALSAPVTVYEADVATLFGPGLFGKSTACSEPLAPSTIGVAHRTLACGTRVEVYYGGRRAIASVIDRGPFVGGVTWDLTSGLARELGFPGRGYVGTIVVGRGGSG